MHLHNSFVRCLLANAQGKRERAGSGDLEGCSRQSNNSVSSGKLYGLSKTRKAELAESFGDGRNSLKFPFYRDLEKYYVENSNAAEDKSGQREGEDKGKKRGLDSPKREECVGEMPAGYLDLTRMAQNPVSVFLLKCHYTEGDD